MRKISRAGSAPSLTFDARTALNRAGFSRREFLKGSGALIVTFSLGTSGLALKASAAQFGGPLTAGSPPVDQVDSWIAVGADGTVTAYSGKCELGQGISTAQIQLVAEELCVPFERVKLVYCDTSITPDQGITSGSQSHPANFNQSNLAQAAATAREALVALAAKQLGAPASDLIAENGEVRVKAAPSRKVSYGQLIDGKKFSLNLDKQAKRRPASEWTVLGKPAKRPDLPEVVSGEFEFVHNVRVPGMLHGAVVRPPAVGATLVAVDESSVAALPGFVKVVVKKNFVGVVAEKPWQALQAAQKLKATWTPGIGLPAQATFYEHMRNQKPSRDTLVVDSQDVEQVIAKAPTTLKATYYHPHQMHGSVGSSCAVADVQGDKATIWSATQGVWHQHNTAAMVLGLKPENVRVIFRRGSGCYGINGADTVTYDAALLSQAVGKPVRVQLSRKDEMAWENYGYPFVLDERAALDAQGNIIAWDHECWFAVKGFRPGPGTPGNIVTGMLLGFPAVVLEPRSPAPAPSRFVNNANAAPPYVAGCVGGRCEGRGTIKSERALVHNVASPFWTGPLRGPGRVQAIFAHECFMDELAAAAKADPVAFRLRHLTDPRLADVVREAAKLAKWDARPSPSGSAPKSGWVAGRGIACIAYEIDNGFSGVVTEVEVQVATGRVVVKRMAISSDCGPISNPDGLRNQVEGGALQGVSRALLEEVTWDDQKVTSIDWRSYRTLPLGFEVPEIETILIDRPDEKAMGAGETTVSAIAASIGNAIFDATGARVRQIPFTAERVKAAMNQKQS